MGESVETMTPPAKSWRADLVSGFLVFLIALPLCLGIASACKYPPIAGIWTAVIGGILCSLLSNSQLTIKGPAAGLIVIVEGAVLELGKEFVPGGTAAEQFAVGYHLALGVGVTAGVIQILFGLFKAGRLGQAVPLTPLHGMLASIGITIMAKSFFPMLGRSAPGGEPIRVIGAIPGDVPNLIPMVTIIGLLSLAILVVYPFVKSRVRLLQSIPAQMIVFLLSIPLGIGLGLAALGKELGTSFLIYVPSVLNDAAAAFAFPDFRGLETATGIKYVILFAMIGSVESLLSSQAVDLLDPWRRKTDQNRDLFAVGVANTICSTIGALPMISEIVRSAANVNNGAYSRKANLFHGLFLLVFVALMPWLINLIPLAALAAMLVYTGFRLASPNEFLRVVRVGWGQLFVFVGTILVTLSTDLLIGLAAGIALELVLHRLSGAPIWSLVVPVVRIGEVKGKGVTVAVGGSAVFSTWLALRKRLDQIPPGTDVVVDLSATWLVDHTVMEKLHEVEKEMAAEGGHLQIVGLEGHQSSSSHPLAARRRRLEPIVS